MFLEQHLFSLYHSLTNNTVDRHYHIFVVDIGSVTLMIVLPIGISKITFINSLHIPIFGADLIGFDIIYYKGTLI